MRSKQSLEERVKILEKTVDSLQQELDERDDKHSLFEIDTGNLTFSSLKHFKEELLNRIIVAIDNVSEDVKDISLVGLVIEGDSLYISVEERE